MTIEETVKRYKYRPLPKDVSKKQRALYISAIDDTDLSLDGDSDCILYYHGMTISQGYNRIVVGDYGAYIEISPEQLEADICVKPGEEYRLQEQYVNVKYHWYCLKRDTDFKIYYQVHPVIYADYKPGMYYIAPDDIRVVKTCGPL